MHKCGEVCAQDVVLEGGDDGVHLEWESHHGPEDQEREGEAKQSGDQVERHRQREKQNQPPLAEGNIQSDRINLGSTRGWRRDITGRRVELVSTIWDMGANSLT